MKFLKSMLATFAMVLAVNGVANAQTNDDETVAYLGENSVEESFIVEESENVEAIKVWPQVSSIKIMVDVENQEFVEIYNQTGRLVLTQKVAKGQSINIETLLPGRYTVKAEGKQGTFTKR
ncbi:MAG: T9SS type A sorting domain-containing protein [Bacteroidales bacterium]|nr:T9SS type A sorting domain-containing protein [Bacteroidales bacterium]